MQAIHDYIREVNRLYTGGKATEHSYRPALQTLVEAILGERYELTNEPRRQACGAPDFILEKGDIPIGYIEAKDVNRLDALNPVEKDQFTRYTTSLDNLVYTDYLEFRFYRKAELMHTLTLARVVDGKVVVDESAVQPFINSIREFASYQTQTITNARLLAELMARKALMIKDVFINILEAQERSSLHDQYAEFKRVLLHNVTYEEFADIYAETIAYGLFTARLHDTTLETFSRGEAYGLIPRSNPFLRELFTYVGTKLDERAEWIVDALCDVFRATDVHKLLHDFYRGKSRKDPFLHFYETFLAEYNPAKRKARGVWYTPEPVVQFIVRAVNDVLQTHFNLPDGLADTSKTTIYLEQPRTDGRKGMVKVPKDVHRVQVLDVATGTGTFLAEVVAQVHEKFISQQGQWSSYVEKHLIPRLHGFELLMASYAMCHMKLELLLEEYGYQPRDKTAPRLQVYLTNSLQKPDDVARLPLIEWFSRESNEASHIKQHSPIMVAIGNPPYSGISSNMGDDLMVSIEPYKYVKGAHFKERKHWLHDDYVKFIRLAEHYIAKNGEGVMGYITNHSWLDNPTFRGMRWHLLQTFDVLYVLNLHGNAKKKEVCPDGSADKNVFDIQQGVSITIGVKNNTKAKNALAKVYHADLWGPRPAKYAALEEGTLASMDWQELTPQEPFYFLVPKDLVLMEKYMSFFSVSELFSLSSVGIVTFRDKLTTDSELERLWKRVQSFSSLPVEEARHVYNLGKDVRDWSVENAQKSLLKTGPSKEHIQVVTYRPFDNKHIYYTTDSKGFISQPLYKVMKHMLSDNLGLVVGRQGAAVGSGVWNLVTVSKNITDLNLFYRGGGTLFPLYRYEGHGKWVEKLPNLDVTIWKKLEGMAPAAADPQAVFDYVYAVLHAPTYRTRYAEFLKSDFPRIPYPASAAQFAELAKLGAHLRQLHLLEHPDCDHITTGYPVDGSHRVEAPRYDAATHRIYLNETQYFSEVPEAVWNFPIGGYQPAQKWLKDRKGRELTLEDITHYQRILATLAKTAAVMEDVDGVYEK